MRRNQKRTLPNPVVAIVVILVVGIVVGLAFRGELPFRDRYTVSAVVTSASDVRPNSLVRIAGVNVGKVVEVEGARDGAATKITMRIEQKGLPLHEDATLKIRPRIFLEGNFFVDLEPGSPSAPVVEEGHVFPINQAQAPVQIDQVVTSLQADTRKDLKQLLTSLSTGLGGGGAEGFNRSQRFWKAAYRDSAIVNDATLGEKDGDLSGYIRGAGATAAALDANGPQLKALITDLNGTARAFAVQDDQLRATISELPRTLDAALPALAALNRAFPPVRRVSVALRPGTRSTGPTIDASLPFLRQARALVSEPELRGLSADLRPTVAALARVNQVTPPLLTQGRALSSCQNEVILPFTSDTIVDEQFPASGPVFEDSFKTLPGLAGESRSGDANGQWFRVLVGAGNYATPTGVPGEIMTSSQPIMGFNPKPPRNGRSPLRSNVPCETQEPPDLRSTPGTMAGQQRASVPASRRGEYLKLQGDAMAWLRLQLDTDKQGRKVEVSSPQIPAAKVEELARQLRTRARRAAARSAKGER